jgi:hypothetical protein
MLVHGAVRESFRNLARRCCVLLELSAMRLTDDKPDRCHKRQCLTQPNELLAQK